MDLNETQVDFVKEIFNTGLGEAAVELSELVEDEVLLSVPQFSLIPSEELTKHVAVGEKDVVTTVTMELIGDMSGNGMLIFPAANSLDLVRTIVEESAGPENLTDLEEEALSEIAGIILNHMVTTFSSFLNINVKTGMPRCHQDTLRRIMQESYFIDGMIMFIGMSFEVKSLNLAGDILFLQNVDTTEKFLSQVVAALEEYDLD